MRRTLASVLFAVSVLLALAVPAVAQTYGGGGGGGGGGGTTTTTASTTTTTDQQPQAEVGSAEPTDVNPGDTVTFNTGDSLGDCTSADVFFVRALQDAPADQLQNNAPVTNGSLSTQFQVPAVPAGIYMVYASCTDSSGDVLQSLGVVVVFTDASPAGAGPASASPASADPGASATGGSASSDAVAPPGPIAAIQTTPATEQALLSEAKAAGESVTVIDGQLAVSRPKPSEAATATAPAVAAAIAGALALLGLVVVRRRRHAS